MKQYSILIIFCVIISSTCNQEAKNTNPDLEKNFTKPTRESHVMTWWHWMNGNITKNGITNDLISMKNAGIQGAILFNVGLLPEGNVQFMSKEWWDHLGFAMQKADSLEMKFGIFNSDGWSMSGGPWITPEESMKKLVWTETLIQGGENPQIVLEKPAFNLIYQDIAVIAYPAIQENDHSPANIVSKTNVENANACFDHDPESQADFNKNDGNVPSLVIDLGSQQTIRKVRFDHVSANNFLDASARIEYSDNGDDFTPIEGFIPLNLKAESNIKGFTFSFPAIEAQFIKVVVDFETSSDKTPSPMHQESIGIGELTLSSIPTVNLWEPKSGQSKRIRHDRQIRNQQELSTITEENIPNQLLIKTDEIKDLTQHLKGDSLFWKAPEGAWKIVRLGYSSTGRKNSPSTEAGRGLECDKMSASATEKHFNGYVAKVNDLSRKLLNKPIDFMQMESWEAGIQNWTAGFEKAFAERNGYSIIPWLPVMAGGGVVNSYEESNRFLWDLRNTIAGMMSDNYWAVMHRLAKENDIKVLGEGSGMQHYLYDPVMYHQHTDIPMGEFWSNEGIPRADCKNAASVANTLGKELVAAESFTGAGSPGKELWRITPYDLKKLGDHAFILGVNQFVLHTFVHQPYEVGPGLTLSRFGNHFQRHNTWYNQAQGWFEYLARCQYLLRQGKTVTDICYFTGEGIPGYLGLPEELSPQLPDGYDYDGVNLELIREMIVNSEQNLELPSGQTYQLLAIQGLKQMTPELIGEIKRLVHDGALVVSPKPLKSPSLKNHPECDREVQQISNEVWGKLDGITIKENYFGKGKVVWGIPLNELLEQQQCLPDFAWHSDQDGQIKFIHKKMGETDIYFLSNPLKESLEGKAHFRINKKSAECWYPDNGKLERISSAVNDEITEIPLSFDPLESVFIIFREINSEYDLSATAKIEFSEEIDLTGPWQVTFHTSSDSSQEIQFSRLVDWTSHTSDFIKYYSGTAVYTNNFDLNDTGKKKYVLDLGEVKNLATVYLNGQKVANLWKPPYNTEITEFIQTGSNLLEIHLTNTAINRLIGDEQYALDAEYKWGGSMITEFPVWLKNPEKRNSERTTFVTYRFFNQDSSLEPSGLIGPVTIKIANPN